MLRRTLALVLLLICCEPRRAALEPSAQRVASARVLTREYSHSTFARWKLRARAAGRDCDVLVISTSNVLDDAIVEGLHYGGGPYGVIEGGVRQFCRKQAFRGVAYKDRSQRIWTYGGDLKPDELPRLKPCG